MKFLILLIGIMLFAADDIIDVEYPNYYKNFKNNIKKQINKEVVIYFAFDSYKVDNKYLPILKEISNYKKIIIKGYSDDYGDAFYNKYLSQKRADKIKDILLNFNSSINIKAIGMGEVKQKGKKYRKAIIFIKD